MPLGKKLKHGRYRQLIDTVKAKLQNPDLTRRELQELRRNLDDPDFDTSEEDRERVDAAIFYTNELWNIILDPNGSQWSADDLQWAVETHMTSNELNTHVDRSLIKAWNKKDKAEKAAVAAAAEQSGA